MMKKEYIDRKRLKEMEDRLGCTFCSDGTFAEMSLDLENYRERTLPIAHVDFAFYHGSTGHIREVVAQVDPDWCRYFHENESIFCGYLDDRIVSFCIVDANADCILSRPGIRVGSIGCVGTIPEHRGMGIGLRMVDLATFGLKSEHCDKAYISYTHIENWYAKLGYETFARFSFR